MGKTPQLSGRRKRFALAEASGPRTVLVVPDKFKGTLSASAAAEAIGKGWLRARPQDRVRLLPMSDGGDGFGEVMGAGLGAKPQLLAAQLRDVDLVLTGEGAIDEQTMMGKGPGQVGQWCRQRKISCLGLAGTILPSQNQGCFTQTHALTEMTSLQEAKRRPAYWLERLSEKLARQKF